MRIFAGHLADVTAIEWHPNSHYVASGSNDCQVRVWSVETGSCERAMFTCESAVRSLKFSRSGLHLFAGNDVGQIVIFDVQQGCALEIIQSCSARAIWNIDVSWDD